MQIMVIALLIVIAGLIGALLTCATLLINRVRAANATLRRIEEALLSLNRVKAIDPAIKSVEPVKQSQPADAGSGGFLTIRELRMSSRDRQSADGAPIPNGRKPLRTSVATSSRTDLQSAAEPTANDELPIQKASAAAEAPVAISLAVGEMASEVSTSNSSMLEEPGQAPTVESAVGREVPEVGQGGRTAPTRTALDEDLKKKRAQQALMIISSRRRRARAGR